MKFRFAGRAMANMTDLELETLIAHEFAHGVFHRKEVEQDLDPEDAAIIDQFDAEALAVAGNGEEIDKEAVLKVFRGQFKRRTDWIEPAVHKRILSWNPQYDDRILRDWLAYYLKHRAPPPRAERVPVALVHSFEDVDKTLDDTPSPRQQWRFFLTVIVFTFLGVVVLGLWVAGVL